MMKKHTTQKIAGALIPAALFLGLASSVLAESIVSKEVNPRVPAGTKAQVKTTVKADALRDREESSTDRDVAAIDKRIADLSNMKTRVLDMKHLNAAQKATFSASIDSTIGTLTTLKAKIIADTTAADRKADRLAIAQSVRVYMLVMPQIRIAAAADRANTVADMLTALDTKFSTRISEAKAAGKDVAALLAAQADMKLKVADAKVQAVAAITAASGLTPDNGDKVKMEANAKALKTARTELKAAEKDLKAAFADVRIITAGLKDADLKIKSEGSNR
jgi:hypothetical protein